MQDATKKLGNGTELQTQPEYRYLLVLKAMHKCDTLK